METSFKPVNMESLEQNPNNTNGDSSYSYKNREEDSGMGFFQTSLIIITSAMFLIAVSLFVWRLLLNNKITSSQVQLEALQKNLDSSQFDDVKKMSFKLRTAKILLENKPFISDIFKILEHSVEPGVVYNKFDTHNDVASGNYYVDISGTAPSYSVLIQQIDVLKKEAIYATYFLSTEVGDFKPNARGSIDFSMKIKSNINGVRPDVVYSDLLKLNSSYNDYVYGVNVSYVATSTSAQTPMATTTSKKTLEIPKTINNSGI